jgi:cyclopropane fatty-acyl-phospholipid synthase-like methyltransferase
MNNPLTAASMNLYGDTLIPTTGIHGGDISSQRSDELDLDCLRLVEKRARVELSTNALDLGGGLGAHSKRMARLGANVVLIDLTDQSDNIKQFNAEKGHDAIHFYQWDVRDFKFSNEVANFDLVYSQRMLSCIRYHEAESLICRVREVCSPSVQYFLSAGGLSSEIGRSNTHCEMPIKNRWGFASGDLAHRHQILAPECPYSEDEFVCLLKSCQLTVVRSWTSPSGNPKAICINA